MGLITKVLTRVVIGNKDKRCLRICKSAEKFIGVATGGKDLRDFSDTETLMLMAYTFGVFGYLAGTYNIEKDDMGTVITHYHSRYKNGSQAESSNMIKTYLESVTLYPHATIRGEEDYRKWLYSNLEDNNYFLDFLDLV